MKIFNLGQHLCGAGMGNFIAALLGAIVGGAVSFWGAFKLENRSTWRRYLGVVRILRSHIDRLRLEFDNGPAARFRDHERPLSDADVALHPWISDSVPLSAEIHPDIFPLFLELERALAELRRAADIEATRDVEVRDASRLALQEQVERTRRLAMPSHGMIGHQPARDAQDEAVLQRDLAHKATDATAVSVHTALIALAARLAKTEQSLERKIATWLIRRPPWGHRHDTEEGEPNG